MSGRTKETHRLDLSPRDSPDETASGGATPNSDDVSGLAALLKTSRQATSSSEAAFVATCADARHPTLFGRVKVYEGDPSDDGSARARWVPTLHGLTIRQGDRLLLQRVAGSSEPIVVGVIDGFLPRPEPERSAGPPLELKKDESIRIHGEDGRPLLEIFRQESGPILRILGPDLRIDVPGKMSITAKELELRAVNGDLTIEASDKVSVDGEAIRLN